MSSRKADIRSIQHAMSVRWDGLGQEFNDGNPVRVMDYSSFTVAFQGVFDGAKVRLKGSIDQEEHDFHTLNDNQGDSITTSTPKIVRVNERVREIIPIVENATNKTNIKVTLLCCP